MKSVSDYTEGLDERRKEKVKARAADLARDVAEKDKPLSELYRLAALEWGDVYSAWYTMSENKTTTLALFKTEEIVADPKLSEAKAERLAKSTIAWQNYMKDMCALHKKALRLRAYKESIDMRYHEKQGRDASARKERSLY